MPLFPHKLPRGKAGDVCHPAVWKILSKKIRAFFGPYFSFFGFFSKMRVVPWFNESSLV